ncbi:hypothetical protein N9Y71_03625 [Luminiphilus sp.]|nr:hypothetical protein [Luminiphilus sp.]
MINLLAQREKVVGQFVFAIALVLLPLVTLSQDLVEFENGQVADADDINANFSLLDERLTAIEYAPSQETSTEPYTKGWAIYYADCAKNEWSLLDQWSDIEKESRVIVKIEGTCVVDTITRISTVEAQALYLDGRDSEGDCNSAGLKTSNDFLISQIGNQSSLTLNCVALPALAFTDFRLSGQSSLRLLSVSSDVLPNVNLRQASFFYNNSTALSNLYAEGASTIDFFDTLDITFLNLLSGSVFVSRDAGKNLEDGADSDMKIQSINLESSSRAVISRPRVEVLIDSIDAEGMSYFEVAECKEDFQVKVREDSYRVSSVGYIHRDGAC